MSNDRLYQAIANVSFNKILLQYTLAKGAPFWTLRDQQSALANYITIAKTLN